MKVLIANAVLILKFFARLWMLRYFYWKNYFYFLYILFYFVLCYYEDKLICSVTMNPHNA